MNDHKSIFEIPHDPILQAIFCLVASVFIMLLAVLLNYLGIVESSFKFTWITAGAFLMSFIMFNIMISFSVENMNRYWGRSFLGLFILFALSSGAAYYISGKPIEEAGSFKWIYMVLGLGYLVLLSIVNVLKNTIKWLQNKDIVENK